MNLLSPKLHPKPGETVLFKGINDKYRILSYCFEFGCGEAVNLRTKSHRLFSLQEIRCTRR